MPSKKKRSAGRKAGSKKAAVAKRSAAKPLTILALGVAAAAAAAVFFASGGTDLATAPAADVSLAGGGHVRGPENAAVTLVEFGDYQCPTCADFHHVVSDLMARLPDTLEFEFHHYPLPVGAHSFTAAIAAEAAAEQGRFWDMHDAIFETHGEWSVRENALDYFIALAGRLGFDADRFAGDMHSTALLARVSEDRQRGLGLDVHATPTFFVNGQRLETLPQSVGHFEAIVRSAMDR